MASKLGKLDIGKTVFFLCDIQEKFRASIQYFPEILVVAQRLIQAATSMEIPVVCTEQYPKGLGNIVPELTSHLAAANSKTFEKTRFTMLTDDVKKHLGEIKPNLKSAILFGIEAHVCVQQTAIDLLEAGYEVHVVADSTSSRSMTDRMLALDRIRQSGAFITTSESVLFMLLQDAKHPKFREVQKLIIESAPYQGLVPKL